MPAESHSALDNSLETFAVKRGFGGVARFHIAVGTDLHAKEGVGCGRDDVRRKLLLLQGVGEGQRVAFASQCSKLQRDGSFGHRRGLKTRWRHDTFAGGSRRSGSAFGTYGRRGGRGRGFRRGLQPIVCFLLRVEVPFAGSRGSGVFGILFLFLCLRRRGIGRSSGGQSAGKRGRGLDGAAVWIVAHDVTESEENSAQEHDAKKKSHQMPALEHPVAAPPISLAARHAIVLCATFYSLQHSPTAK